MNAPLAESVATPAASAPAAAASAQGRSLVFADLAMVVQDLEAHALAFGWRGAGSTKCCPRCLNVVSKHCKLVRGPTGGTIPVYTTGTSRFQMMSDRTFSSMQHRLHQLALHHPRELSAKEQVFGFGWVPDGWLQDTELAVRPMRVLAFDWMHCWCEKGYGSSSSPLVWTSCVSMGMEVDSCMYTCSTSSGQRQMQVAAMFARAASKRGRNQQMSHRLDQPQQC